MTRNQRLLAALTLVGASAGGNLSCTAHAGARGYVETGPPVVFYEPPTLVEIEAGLWVVRDYDYPVYYSDGYYWAYRDHVWYRSPSYDRGWARIGVSTVPLRIATRDHPTYVHYRGSALARTRVAPARMTPAGGPPAYRGTAPREFEQRQRQIDRQERALEQRNLELERRNRAAEERDRAERQRIEAEERRNRAERQRIEAEEGAARAAEPRNRAEQQRIHAEPRNRAEQQRIHAEQRNRAEQQRIHAEPRKQAAEQRARARQQAKPPGKQRKAPPNAPSHGRKKEKSPPRE